MLSLWNLCKIYDKNQRFWLSFKQTSNKATFATRYQLHTKKTTLWSWNGFNWFMRSNPVSASDNSLVIFSSYLLMSNYWGRLIHFKINELIFYKQLLKSQSQANFLGLYSRFRNDPALISPEQILIYKVKNYSFMVCF